jgi:hypothetical protein
VTTLAQLRHQIEAVRATMPTTSKPISFVFASADGELNQHNAERLRIARAAGEQVVTFQFMSPPSEELSS